MAAFEWAQVIAFDGPEISRWRLTNFWDQNPTLKLRSSRTSPCCILHWALDDFTIALKRSAMRGEASNAVDAPSEAPRKKVRIPKSSEIFVAVHRLNYDLYYKRLDRNAYLLLTHLQHGKTLAGAVAATIKDSTDSTEWTSNIQAWFTSWTQMGWLCKFSNRPE